MSSPIPRPFTFWRRYRFPLILLPIPILLIVLMQVLEYFTPPPETSFYVGIAMWSSFIIVPLIILFWFLVFSSFFSSFSRQARLKWFLILVILVGLVLAYIVINHYRYWGME